MTFLQGARNFVLQGTYATDAIVSLDSHQCHCRCIKSTPFVCSEKPFSRSSVNARSCVEQVNAWSLADCTGRDRSCRQSATAGCRHVPSTDLRTLQTSTNCKEPRSQEGYPFYVKLWLALCQKVIQISISSATVCLLTVIRLTKTGNAF